jgi:hypothetical protein
MWNVLSARPLLINNRQNALILGTLGICFAILYVELRTYHRFSLLF